MMPPEPTRMRSVAAATSAMTTTVAEESKEPALWCSATQKRSYPKDSAARAASMVLSIVWCWLWSERCGIRSRTEIFTLDAMVLLSV